MSFLSRDLAGDYFLQAGARGQFGLKQKMASVPKPGPANLSPGAGLDEWLEEAKQCHYLPEPVMKQLCEIVKEVLMEGKASPSAPLCNPRSVLAGHADAASE